MQIEVIGVNVVNKGKYRQAEVTFKNTDSGKVDAKNVMSFTYKDVFKTLSEAKQGDVFDVKAEKNDKGYWDWTEVGAAGKNTGSETRNQAYQAATKTSRDFETSEERAKKQVYIVRQSSITAALELLKANNPQGEISVAGVIETARQFEQYVFDIQPIASRDAPEVS